MFHLPIEMVVYVPSTQDVDKVITVDEMNTRVEGVKKYLAGLFGGYTSSEKLGGYVATNSELVNEQIVQVVAFSTKEAFETNKEKVINKLSEWAKQWGQEAIGFEYEGDLFYVPQKFGMGGFVIGAIAGVIGTLYYQKRNKKGAKKGSKKYFEGGDIEGYDTYVVEFKKSGQTRRVGVVAHNEKEAVAKAKKMISGKGYTVGNVRRFAEGGGVESFDEETIKKKRSEMYIALNTKTGQVYVGGIKPKNRLFKDEKGYYLIDGYGKFMGKKYPVKKHFSPLENAVLSDYMEEKFGKGGKTERTKYAVSVDKRYKSSKPSGRRVSSKYSTITMADGTTFRRRNANQTGDVKGGRTYNEKRPNRTDRKGTQVPLTPRKAKAVVSSKPKSFVAQKPKTMQRSKPAQKKYSSDKLKFLGVEFKRYDYSIGGL
jgi:hypothetical protein